MKLNVTDVPALKKEIIAQLISNVELEAEALESQYKEEIESLSGGRRESREQKARLAISALKTPLGSLRPLLTATIPAQTDDTVREYSLFDLTTVSKGTEKVTTYFVLPVDTLEKIRPQVHIGEHSVTALSRKSLVWQGWELNRRTNVKASKIWEEPFRDQYIDTGRVNPAETIWLSWVYK